MKLKLFTCTVRCINRSETENRTTAVAESTAVECLLCARSSAVCFSNIILVNLPKNSNKETEPQRVYLNNTSSVTQLVNWKSEIQTQKPSLFFFSLALYVLSLRSQYNLKMKMSK